MQAYWPVSFKANICIGLREFEEMVCNNLLKHELVIYNSVKIVKYQYSTVYLSLQYSIYKKCGVIISKANKI